MRSLGQIYAFTDLLLLMDLPAASMFSCSAFLRSSSLLLLGTLTRLLLGDGRARDVQVERDCQRLDIIQQHTGRTHSTHDSAHCFDDQAAILCFLPGLDSINNVKASLEINSPMSCADSSLIDNRLSNLWSNWTSSTTVRI